MPVLSERIRHGVRSDGRANYRYRDATEATVIEWLSAHGWSQTEDGTLQRSPEPQYTTFATATRHIVEETRPNLQGDALVSLTSATITALESGAEFRTDQATYVGYRITANGMTTAVVRRTPNRGAARIDSFDCYVITENATLTAMFDPELEALLAEEEAIEREIRAQRERQAEAAERLERDRAAAAAYESAAALLQAQRRQEREAFLASPSFVISDEPVARTRTRRARQTAEVASNPYPGYDGRLP